MTSTRTLEYQGGLSEKQREQLILRARGAARVVRLTGIGVGTTTVLGNALFGPTASMLIGAFGTVTWVVLSLVSLLRHPVLLREIAQSWCWLIPVFCVVVIITTVAIDWPLRLTFAVFRPRMELLAERVAAGQPVTAPRWVGPWRIVASEMRSGCVCLWTSANPAGPEGFVRHPQGSAFRFNVWTNVHLNDRWQHASED